VQCASAAKVAAFLASHPRVAAVRYPGLPGDSGHARARAQMPDFGTIIAVDLAGTAEQSRRFADALNLFAITASLGSTESLIVPPTLQRPRDLGEAQLQWAGIGPTTARISIGLEDPEDLVEDLATALAEAFA